MTLHRSTALDSASFSGSSVETTSRLLHLGRYIAALSISRPTVNNRPAHHRRVPDDTEHIVQGQTPTSAMKFVRG